MQAASATNDVDEDADEDALLAEATEEADVVDALLAEETEDALLTEETEDALETEEVARRTILPIWSAPHK